MKGDRAAAPIFPVSIWVSVSVAVTIYIHLTLQDPSHDNATT